jgi:hypothetical protein
MQTLTVQLDKKECTICGKIFSRPISISSTNWSLRKTCSLKCRLIRTSNKPAIGKALRYNIRAYECCLCGTRIMGTKKTLQKHKSEYHAY